MVGTARILFDSVMSLLAEPKTLLKLHAATDCKYFFVGEFRRIYTPISGQLVMSNWQRA
jgi:hypothetical protein